MYLKKIIVDVGHIHGKVHKYKQRIGPGVQLTSDQIPWQIGSVLCSVSPKLESLWWWQSSACVMDISRQFGGWAGLRSIGLFNPSVVWDQRPTGYCRQAPLGSPVFLRDRNDSEEDNNEGIDPWRAGSLPLNIWMSCIVKPIMSLNFILSRSSVIKFFKF